MRSTSSDSVVADPTRRDAARRQGGEPDHHRLDPPRPVHGHQRPPRRGARRRRPTTPPAEPPSRASPATGAWCSPAPRSRRASTEGQHAVDLSIAGPRPTTLVFTATGVLTGPGTADQSVPDDKRPRCWRRSPPPCPGQKLPFGIAPTSEGAPRLRRHHRGHRAGSNHPARRVQTVMSFSGRAFAVIASTVAAAAVIGLWSAGARRCLAGHARRRRRTHRRRPRLGLVSHGTDRRALQRGVVRTVRSRPPRGPPGVRATCLRWRMWRSTWTPIRRRRANFPCCRCRRRSSSMPSGRQRYRAAGVPTAADLRSALQPLLA